MKPMFSSELLRADDNDDDDSTYLIVFSIHSCLYPNVRNRGIGIDFSLSVSSASFLFKFYHSQI